ncbi:penicillin-binding protein [Ilyomonas limi]|uniref:Penicillin-binding protein n=1 Tax=Ilyomonas limi TaxID=2575867 RepID=A0A4U3L3W9_9BACT|nr:transglycosylase domain-containing protein [Ilyomonas limi]TKK68237.1 penicillin-binding protein [Ilyomonas limi]
MKKAVKYIWILFFSGLLFVVLMILLADWGVFGKMPSIEELQNPSASLASQVYAADGTLMGKYYLEDRVNVEYKDISKHVINALVATEDERFYEHSGIDARALGRAITSLGTEGGASTITMQTAKNLFTDYSPNTLKRIVQKLKEAIIAIKLERNFTKQEIITLYLNTVPFGDNVYGIRNAAKTFFKKEPDRLTVGEAAVLIGMLKASNTYNPRINPKRARERRNIVLDQMVRNNYITKAEADAIKVTPIPLNYEKLNETTGLAPYFRMVLGEEMKRWCKDHKRSDGEPYDLYRDGLKIYTTINPRMQIYAEEAVGKHMSEMQRILNSQSNIKNGSVWKGHENVLQAAMKVSDRWKNMKQDGATDEEIKKSFYVKVPMKVFAWNKDRSKDTVMTPYDSIKYHRQMLQAGFMVMDPLSGEVRAWVGGIDFKTYKFDHVNLNTKRQVGSTIKPLLYSLAIEDAGFTPETPVEDEQQDFGSFGMVPATPTSCTGRTIPMISALTWSRNCATAYIMKQLGNGNEGAKRFVEFLKNCNVTTKIEPYPSIALGAEEISLYEMMQAYSMFPGRGFNTKPLYITRIEDKNGNLLQSNMPQRKEVISDITAYYIISMMESVIKNGTGRRMWSYDVHGDIAGKTGTTNDNSDAWFMGYTPSLLGGVWTGCDDRFIRFNSTAIGQGSSVALPVWAYFYKKISDDKSLGIDTRISFAKPETLQREDNFDYINDVPDEFLGAEGEDVGNGSAEDYSAGQGVTPPPADKNNDYDIQPESKLPADTGKNTNQNQPPPKAVMPKRPR